MKEFAFIDQLTQQFPGAEDVVLGVNDDAAILCMPVGEQLVACTDTMVEGVHFFSNVSPFNLGHKIMAVSLSDVAAMGATPRWALLSMATTKLEPAWTDQFIAGVKSILSRFGVALVGGDTTFANELTLNSQLLGSVQPGQALTRAGAKPGDKIFVTGKLGAPALALVNSDPILQQRLDLPEPRVLEGQALLGIASSAIDISDGLAADLGHILQQSHCGAVIYTRQLPIAERVSELVNRAQAVGYALTGGDEYELCFTVAPERLSSLAKVSQYWPCSVTEIGEIKQGKLLTIIDDQHQQLNLSHLGYEHFSAKKTD